MTEICSFPPIAGNEPLLIILGSMPGEESLRQNRYYAHPRNSFWTILCKLLGSDAAKLDYKGRCALLKNNRVALWDVLQSCRRAGSLDAAIEKKTIVVNDFNAFFDAHPTVRTVIFNGTRAEQEYRKRVLPYLKDGFKDLDLIRLPSTSPAMAMMSLNEKTGEWSVIRSILPFIK